MNKETHETKYISVLVFSIVVICFVVGYTLIGKATSSNLGDLESQKQQNQQNQSSYEQQASQYQESKSSLENLMAGLNSELAVMNDKLANIQKQIEDKNQEIENTRNELEEAKKTEQQQYEDMKLRIKFIYEMGNSSYFEILLSGDNLADNINKAEYVSSLIKYDRKMLQKYKDTKQLIQQKEETLANDQNELQVLKQQVTEQQQLIEAKINDTNQQILTYVSNISEAESAALEYEKKIEADNEAIYSESKRLEEESIIEAESRERASREAEESRKASIAAEQSTGEQQTTSPQEETKPDNNYVPVANDLDKMAAIIECEAGNQAYYGKLCVGAVVMNRINSKRFPNTLTEVLYQPYQFSPVLSGRFELVLARGANEECYKAAREVLEQGNITGTWLFFRVNDGSRQGDVIGDHVFY